MKPNWRINKVVLTIQFVGFMHPCIFIHSREVLHLYKHHNRYLKEYAFHRHRVCINQIPNNFSRMLLWSFELSKVYNHHKLMTPKLKLSHIHSWDLQNQSWVSFRIYRVCAPWFGIAYHYALFFNHWIYHNRSHLVMKYVIYDIYLCTLWNGCINYHCKLLSL